MWRNCLWRCHCMPDSKWSNPCSLFNEIEPYAWQSALNQFIFQGKCKKILPGTCCEGCYPCGEFCKNSYISILKNKNEFLTKTWLFHCRTRDTHSNFSIFNTSRYIQQIPCTDISLIYFHYFHVRKYYHIYYLLSQQHVTLMNVATATLIVGTLRPVMQPQFVVPSMNVQEVTSKLSRALASYHQLVAVSKLVLLFHILLLLQQLNIFHHCDIRWPNTVLISATSLPTTTQQYEGRLIY